MKIQNRRLHEYLLSKFLSEWPFEKLKKMTLNEYVSVGNKETFCQYVETFTKPLGSINGHNSLKFGIYKRKNLKARPQKAISNSEYTWAAKYNNENLDEQAAYKRVLAEVQETASYAIQGQFEKIEDVELPSLFKWKVAFLYSDNRLIPVFSLLNLRQIVGNLGMSIKRTTTYYEMQQFLIPLKKVGETPVEFMRRLFIENKIKEEKAPGERRRNRKRKASTTKRTGQHSRSAVGATTVDNIHNELQLELYEKLCNKYSNKCVSIEKDWADITVELEDKVIIYEVKKKGWVEDCFKEGIGQLLSYAFQASQHYKKQTIELVIAGEHACTPDEKLLLTFIKQKLTVPISYCNIPKFSYH
ncbi:hypothetical protein [Filimonas effusa]|uniref:Uncharacterized protein n=1 Tax=Filimonas effusa TaxID=2508721 RepID=A0A4Q1D0L5_9BACT|nr:hypothetical protein [Filimonas effusa]RXK81284.1 hypothetical protein ESB13_20320 [Filimonas effusa]